MYRIYVLAVAMVLCMGSSAQNKRSGGNTLTPDANNVYVLKNKKQRLVLTYEESKKVKPADIKDLSINGDTLFFTVPAEVFSDFSKRAASTRKRER